MRSVRVAAALMFFAGPAMADGFEAKLLAPWDGVDVPPGQQCTLFGGNGATPPIEVSNLPVGTEMVQVEFNDLSYQPLSENGGHGVIGFDVAGDSAVLPSVPGLTDALPAGIKVVRAARSSGRYASDGYLPPCSGGRGNIYSADIIALDANGNRLASVTATLGRY